jgi:hypothetical protein
MHAVETYLLVGFYLPGGLVRLRWLVRLLSWSKV